MLNWWLGKPTEGNREENENSQLEPPETPAPVFAARALKSAIFGTPAPPDDDFEIEDEPETMPTKGNRRPQAGNMSPTKPPGILLTPGTATSRRKTVSFGNEVVDKEEKNVEENLAAKNELSKDNPRKTDQPTRASRKTSLTRVLEDAREERPMRVTSDKPRNSSESRPLLDLRQEDDITTAVPSKSLSRKDSNSQTNQQCMEEIVTKDDFDGDVTMDLNEPHSQSGRYWKSEFENYHEDAKEEMKKLLRYKHMAKTFAKKKDEENIDLCEKLKEEQRRVTAMEGKMSKLSARISKAGSVGHNDDESPEMIKELARQTALALQYKKKVEEFRQALEGNSGQSSKRATASRERNASHWQQGSAGEAHSDSWGASEDSMEASSLREEVQQLKQSLATAEKANQKLQDENTKLTEELLHADLRLERHLEKCEKRRESLEDLRHTKDEALQSLQKTYDTLKQQAKSQRREAEHLLKKRHDQAVELKREIASLRGSDSTAKELQETLQKKTTEHSRVVAEYEIRIAELKRDVILGSDSAMNLKASIQQDPSLSHSLSKHQASIESPQPPESLIPVLSHSISRPSKSVGPSRQSRSETPTGSPAPRTSQTALSEIINNASPNTLPPPRTGPVQFTPLVNRFSNMSMQSPNVQLPSAEPSIYLTPTRTIDERNCHASPRPSMINIPSSPPKAARIRPNPYDDARSSNDAFGGRMSANMASSRLSSMEDSRTRRKIPPERVAAAKARLERKNTEKKKAQATSAGKENVRD